MPNDAPTGVGSVASRSGPIHSFEDDQSSFELYLDNDDGRVVPVVVRSLSSPGVVGRGRLVARELEGDELVGTVEWSADLESRVGSGVPTSHCEFDPATGRLLRVIVELEDDEPEDAPEPPAHDCECGSVPCTCHAGDARDGRPGAGKTPNRGHAEMATQRETVETTDNDQDHPETGSVQNNRGTNSNNRTQRERNAPLNIDELPDDPSVLRAELRRVEEGRRRMARENSERRIRMEELERSEEERRNATLTESERMKRDLQAANQKQADADRRALAAEDRIRELLMDLEIERTANSLGFDYPQDVPKLINRSGIEVEEETGQILGVKAAVERLAKERPTLVSRRGGGTPLRNDFGGGVPRGGRGQEAQPTDIKAAMVRTGKYGRM